MHDDDRIRILHMVDAVDSVAQFLEGKTRADLDSNRMLLFAVVRAIEVFGEAASRVTDGTKAAAPGVPWTLIVGMRNRLVHGYFDIDTDLVWKTATAEIPVLRQTLKTLL